MCRLPTDAFSTVFVVPFALISFSQIAQLIWPARNLAMGWFILGTSGDSVCCRAPLRREGKEDEDIAKALHCHRNTVANVRQRFVEHGLEAALGRKKRLKPPCEKLLDGEKEARLIALSCSQPPPGHARWPLRLLAERIVALEIVESISHETVRRALKETASSPICASAG